MQEKDKNINISLHETERGWPYATFHPSELRVLKVHRHLSLVTSNGLAEREQTILLGSKLTPSFPGAPEAHSALEL